MTKPEVKKAAQFLCKAMGTLLRQEYRLVDGVWWLFSLDKPQRTLTPDEIRWHTVRNHAPFVPDGITVDDPRWFADPEV